MTVWVLVIEHRHGFNHYVNKTKDGMLDTLADYCREWWNELDEPIEMPLTRDDIIYTYFDSIYEEWYTFDECILND